MPSPSWMSFMNEWKVIHESIINLSIIYSYAPEEFSVDVRMWHVRETYYLIFSMQRIINYSDRRNITHSRPKIVFVWGMCCPWVITSFIFYCFRRWSKLTNQFPCTCLNFSTFKCPICASTPSANHSTKSVIAILLQTGIGKNIKSEKCNGFCLMFKLLIPFQLHRQLCG